MIFKPGSGPNRYKNLSMNDEKLIGAINNLSSRVKSLEWVIIALLAAVSIQTLVLSGSLTRNADNIAKAIHVVASKVDRNAR